ncbi:hypothetical protein ACH5RR_001060 [Cinchona calisaya]|uniref:Exocyst complex component Sec8 n=1 Tax=Cinchona calisaya TaxID=153742 RepID=A0ABD3B3H9_9GENT
MIECLCLLGKVAAVGAIICQRLRPTIHGIITAKIKSQAEHAISFVWPGIGKAAQTGLTSLHYMKGQLESYRLLKQKKHQNGISLAGALLAASPVSVVMSLTGTAQASAKELLDSILETVVRIFENHVIVGELLESKSAQQVDLNAPRSIVGEANWNHDPEASHGTGGYSIGFSLTVLQLHQQMLSSKRPDLQARFHLKIRGVDLFFVSILGNNCVLMHLGFRDGSEDGLTFAFRFTEATISIPNQGVDLIRQGWSRRGPNVLQEGYGTAAILPEQGIYLAASTYRPVLQFTDKVASLLPKSILNLGKLGVPYTASGA